MTAINITVPVNHEGHHYQGVSVHAGVDISFTDAPCGPARQLIQFDGAENPPTGIFFDQASCVDDKSEAVPTYLQIQPAA